MSAGGADAGGEGRVSVTPGGGGEPGAIGGNGSGRMDRGGAASGNSGIGCCAKAPAAIEPSNNAAAGKLRIMSHTGDRRL